MPGAPVAGAGLLVATAVLVTTAVPVATVVPVAEALGVPSSSSPWQATAIAAKQMPTARAVTALAGFITLPPCRPAIYNRQPPPY
jgi:hypothetical protein